MAEQVPIRTAFTENVSALTVQPAKDVWGKLTEGNIVDATGLTAAAIWDVFTRTTDAAIQTVASKTIGAPNAVADVRNIASSAAGAVGALFTVKPVKLLTEVASGVSSVLQTAQSAVSQLIRGVFNAPPRTVNA